MRGSWLLCVAMLATGCENELDETANNLPIADAVVPDASRADAEPPSADGGGDGGVTCVAPEAAGCADCPSAGDWYRFTLLQVDALDGRNHPLRPLLNALWAADIERAELNVLFEILEVNGPDIRLRALNAARNEAHDGTYCLLPDTAVEMRLQREGCGFCMSEPAGINIYAGAVKSDEPSGYVPKNCAPDLEFPHTIPIRNVRLAGKHDADCGHILEAKVVGAALPKSALGKVCTCATAPNAYAEQCVATDGETEGCGGCPGSYRNLLTYLEMFGGGMSLQYGCRTPEGEEAVCIDATFAAERLAMTPPNCAE